MTDWRNEMHELPIGKGELLTEGSDVAVLTIGPVALDAAGAVNAAAAEGISVAHADMIFLKPLDTELLARLAADGRPLITVEDGTINGGLGSAVAEWLADNGLHNPLVRMGLPDKFVTQGTPAELRHLCGIDTAAILEAIRKVAGGAEVTNKETTGAV